MKDVAMRCPSQRAPLWKILALGLVALLTDQVLAQVAPMEGVNQCGPTGPPEDCTALIDAKVETGTRSSLLYETRAHAYEHQGNLRAALADYTTALAISPAGSANSKDVLIARGVAYLSDHQPDKAIADLQAASRIGPHEWVILASLGNAYLAKANYVVALSYFDKSIKAEPVLAQIQNRAFALLKLKRYREALTGYNQVLKASPTFPQALMGRGLVKRALGDRAGAERDIASAEKLAPDIRKAFEP